MDDGKTPQMASNDEDSSSTAPEAPAAAAPTKKVVAKRAPRKATKKASAPQQAPESAPTEVTSEPDVAVVPPRKAAKRAPRKTAKKAVAALLDLDPAQAAPGEVAPTSEAPASEAPASEAPARAASAPAGFAPDQAAPAPEAEPAKAPAAQNFGLLFQPPAPTEAPRRRRATAPVAAPTPEQAEAQHTRQAPPSADAAHGDQTSQDAKGSDEADDSGAEGAPRRRRRGGKGRRGRATGEGTADDSATGASTSSTSTGQESAESAPSDPASAQESDSTEGGESHRRTRRRRRGSAGEGDDQQQQPDSSSTTTKVREPRPKRDEVASVKGSTRLEAKKLRRREGREAGRRRTVITEAEFLARRESVERVMVVRHKQDRTQIGVLEDGVLVEHYVSRETNVSMAGNVYLGRIQNVLPSMEAAFVDIGKGRNAVLYAGEVNWDAAGLDNHRARRIENALSSGQSVLVQVTKDPIGHKGARLTSQVSLPGRYLVYVPDGNMMGISRKLPDTERARLKKILREVVPENAGVIVRTAAEGASEEELRADVNRLTVAWEGIQAKAKAKNASAPALLHGEPDLTVRVIRDVFNEDFAKLVASGDQAWDAVSGYVNTVAPDLADRIQKWTGEQDLFTHYRVDEQIAKAMDRKVWLPSGGSLVIDRTEAMTVVDVNTGKFVGSGGNLEETVTKNNIEAAEEVVRQLRLRDIGGIIVIDFIDMVLESNRDLVVRRLLECLGRDRTKHQVAEVTSLGLVQMTRKRVGAGLIEVFSEDCEHCNGRGIIVSADPIDRPSSTDGNNGGNSGGGNSGGGDSGSGRGGRSRRARGTGRDTSVAAVAPEPPVSTGGPTPAQIAAAAHAAAIQAKSADERVEPPVESAPSAETEPAVTTEPATEAERATEAEPASEADPASEVSEVSEPVVNQPQDLPLEEPVAVRTKSRRRSSRSAKSPAISVVPSTETVTDQAVVAEIAVEPSPAAEATPVAQVAVVAAPPARARRKRPRVVAPAGPPRGTEQAEAATGEFGS